MEKTKKIKGYFGTEVPLPELVQLRAGKLSCVYERGSLRYIRVGEEEILRRIYPAVRDEHWHTIPLNIESEDIRVSANSFRITCSASFHQKHIRYRADFEIRGSDMGQISYTMWGEAESDFLRNRIGICVLHPIQECVGQPVEVTTLDEVVQEGTFPELVSPHQPFMDISQFDWRSTLGAEAQLFFEGELFEMEDQRNWSDHSFKTYGTPQRLTKPVQVHKGDLICHKVTLRLKSMPMEPVASEKSHVSLFESELTAPFPKIGYTLAKEPISEAVSEHLRKIPFDHLRIKLDMESQTWEREFDRALLQAQQLQTYLKLVVVLGSHPWQEVVDLVGALNGKTRLISSISLVNEPQEESEDGFLTVAEVLKKYLPALSIGFDPDGFFADLNRNRPMMSHYDFVAFSLTPQVHSTDFRTIIENISAPQFIVQTIHSFGEKVPDIHVSPIRFGIEDLENSHDPRYHSEFGAAFTLLSLRYLAGVDQVTFYETHGPDGVVAGDGAENFPLYDYLKQLKEFNPDRIFLTQSPEPLMWDALVVGNAQGDKHYFLINFSSESVSINLSGSEQAFTLPAESITTYSVSGI